MASFTTRQKRELKKLLSRLPSISNYHDAEFFLLSYIGFESVSRKVWHYYRCRAKMKSESHAGVPIHELKKAFEYFEIKVEHSVVDKMLSSDFTKRNQKSARNLRNAIAHDWKQADCNEASIRVGEFDNCIKLIINSIKIAI